MNSIVLPGIIGVLIGLIGARIITIIQQKIKRKKIDNNVIDMYLQDSIETIISIARELRHKNHYAIDRQTNIHNMAYLVYNRLEEDLYGTDEVFMSIDKYKFVKFIHNIVESNYDNIFTLDELVEDLNSNKLARMAKGNIDINKLFPDDTKVKQAINNDMSYTLMNFYNEDSDKYNL